MKLLNKLLMRVGGVVPIENPRIALVGDSLTQYGNANVLLNGVTLTRDVAGVVTVAKTAHGIWGTPEIYTFNCSDESYEAMATCTVIDANNYSYPTGVIGAAGSISGGSLTQTTIQNRFTLASYFVWLQSRCEGGLRFRGNFGEGADQSDAWGGATALACATDADFVVFSGPINDINTGGVSGATVVSRMQVHVDTCLAAGKKVVLTGVAPIGSAIATIAKNTATLDANTGLAAIAAANPGTVFFANPHPDLVDTGATQFTTGQAWSWVTYDTLHWGPRTANIIGGKQYDAIAAYIETTSVLPTSSGLLPIIPGYTAVIQWGPWTGAGGGTNGTGSSGTVNPNLVVGSSNAATTIVNSLVDRGDGTGYWQHQVMTSGGANHNVTDYIPSSSGVTLASLGLTSADTIVFALECQASNILACSLTGLQLDVLSNGSGLYGLGRCGGFGNTNSTMDDSFSDVLVTGEFKLNASVTTIYPKLTFMFSGADVDPLNFDYGRAILYKKNP